MITSFRKETDDLITATVQTMFNILYGEVYVTANVDSSISLSTPYDSTSDYEVRIFSALDADGTDITEALTITKVSASGFKINSPRGGTVRWTTSRRVPKINFWT